MNTHEGGVAGGVVFWFCSLASRVLREERSELLSSSNCAL